MRAARHTLRAILWAVLGATLLGCAVRPQAPLLRHLLGRPAPPDTATAELAARAAQPGAKLMVLRLLDRDIATTLLKIEDRDGVDVWRTSDDIRLYTRAGLLIATRGLGDDLMSLDAPDTALHITRLAPAQTQRIHRRLDGNDQMRITSYICDIAPMGVEPVRAGETLWLNATRVAETCHSPSGGVTHMHWVHNNRILQSEQSFSPQLGRLQTLFLP